MEIHEYIVVGSGCTGAIASQTLAEKGAKVLILDGGVTEDHYRKLQPQKTFSELRENDNDQHRYFLGDEFESITTSEVGTGAQLTPARRFLIAEVEKYLPYFSRQFEPMESLALGGLGGGWGLGCCVFSDNELAAAGLNTGEMRSAYQIVADRIGICSENDDARKFTGAFLRDLHTPPQLGPTASVLHANYQEKRSSLNANGFFLGRPALALITKEHNGRKPASLRDMDFYDDSEQSAYRPEFTIAELRKKGNVRYEGGWLVTSFEEKENSTDVHALRIGTNEKNVFSCRKLILAPGVLGTARIVLRSMKGGAGKKLPLLCNPYTYLPCIVPSRLGKEFPERDLGFAQLSMFHDKDGMESDIAMASLYTYRSLLLFRLLKETPLNFRDGRIFMQHLLPALVIAGIHHPEKYSPDSWLTMEADQNSPTGDKMQVNYRDCFSDPAVLAREKQYKKALKSIGARALKIVHPKAGASIHYAGVLPFSASEKEFSLHTSGRLHGTKTIFVADGSGFSFLPAKGLTLSLMANAHNTALHALNS